METRFLSLPSFQNMYKQNRLLVELKVKQNKVRNKEGIEKIIVKKLLFFSYFIKKYNKIRNEYDFDFLGYILNILF